MKDTQPSSPPIDSSTAAGGGTAMMKNADGQKLFCHLWEPETEPKALVFLCHGYAEHAGGSYDSIIAQQLLIDGYLLYAHDHVGHGKSEGDRAHIDHFTVYCRDVKQHVTAMKEKHPSLPTFIYGHSMGGAIAVRTAMENKDLFAGVILCAPAITPSPDALRCLNMKLYLAKFLSVWWPQMQMDGLKSQDICRDPQVVEAYLNDPLNWNGGMKVKWALCMFECFSYIKENIHLIDFPLLILHGDDDKLCDIRGSQEIYDTSPSKDKSIKIYKGFYHQLHSEPGDDKYRVINDLRDWLREHV